MIKRIIKILLITFLVLVLAIFYLSFFGIKTDKFNNQIRDNILKFSKNINLNLNEVNYLLNPYNFTINLKSENPQITFRNIKLEIKNITTNISLRSIINNRFIIENIQIKTEEIKFNKIIALAREFKNSPQLFVLDAVIKDGFVAVNINLNFDELGKIKENFKIEGIVKKAKLNILNQIKLKNLNFNFDVDKNIYSLQRIDMKFNNYEQFI